MRKMLPKIKQTAKFETALKRIKKFIVRKKVFRKLKKITNFADEDSKIRKKSAKLNKRQQFKQIQ